MLYTEALSTADIAKLRTEVVDVIPPEVFEDMSVSQLKVKNNLLSLSLSLSLSLFYLFIHLFSYLYLFFTS